MSKGTKSEKKMFIKQNTQITLAFLKKICRVKNTEQYKELLSVVNRVESGQMASKVKE